MIKKLLPLLLCYVLTQSQCFAISGGPNYGGSGNVNTVGSYSGVLQGASESDASGTTSGAPPIPGDTVPGGTSDNTSSNALGIFNLVVPGATTGTGAFLLFADGVVFGGTIFASVDPDSDKLSGILQGQYTISETFSVTGDVNLNESDTTVAGLAVGAINAKIGASGSHSVSAARLTGSAFLQISFGAVNTSTNVPVVDKVISFTVSGFQTTTATTTASTLGTAGSAGTGGQTSG